MTNEIDTNSGPTELAPAPEPPKRRFGPGNGYPRFRIKLDDLLRDEHRADYESLILKKTTLPALIGWLNARGYDVGRCTVLRHRQEFLRDVREVERSSQTALRFARLARQSGATLSDATIGGLHQVLMEFFTREQAAHALTAKDVNLLASAVDSAIATSAKVASVRKELAAAADASRKVDGQTVVDRVREIIGV